MAQVVPSTDFDLNCMKPLPSLPTRPLHETLASVTMKPLPPSPTRPSLSLFEEYFQHKSAFSNYRIDVVYI
jgi:hypothetical protein